MLELRNATTKSFLSLDSEKWRSYTFADGSKVRIENPQWINTGPGGHRILDAQEHSHYIPKGWVHLEWEVKSDKPHFDF